jgi:hypothetical protein
MKIAITIRWSARAISAALATLFIVLFVGEGPPPMFEFSLTALESWLTLMIFSGFIATWRYELWGGVVSLGAMAGFYLADFAASGFRHWPRGWMFPTLALVPMLFLLAWWLGHGHRHGK